MILSNTFDTVYNPSGMLVKYSNKYLKCIWLVVDAMYLWFQ